MNDTALRGMGETGGDLQNVGQCLGDGQAAAAIEDRPQVLAIDELEGDEVEPLVLAAEEDARTMFS